MKNILWLTLFSSLLLSGCTAIMWERKPVRETNIQQTIVSKDNIYTFATMTKTKESKGKAKATPTLLLLGEQYTYVLDEGADQLLSVLTSPLNNPALSLNRNKLLSFELDSPNTFSANIALRYKEPEQGYTKKEQDLLTKLGFNYYGHDKMSYKNIAFKGSIQEASSLVDSIKQNKGFRAPYPVSFYTESRTENVNVGRLISKIIATPFTLIGDLVIVPVGAAAIALGGGITY